MCVCTSVVAVGLLCILLLQYTLLFQTTTTIRSTADERAALDCRGTRISPFGGQIADHRMHLNNMNKRKYKDVPGEQFDCLGKRVNKLERNHNALLGRMQANREKQSRAAQHAAEAKSAKTTALEKAHAQEVDSKSATSSGKVVDLLPLSYRLRELQSLRSQLVVICKHVHTNFGVDWPFSRLLNAVMEWHKERLKNPENPVKPKSIIFCFESRLRFPLFTGSCCPSLPSVWHEGPCETA